MAALGLGVFIAVSAIAIVSYKKMLDDDTARNSIQHAMTVAEDMLQIAVQTKMNKLQTEADLKKYLEKRNIATTRTPNGVFVNVQDFGSGETVDSGKLIKVLYTGKNLDGKIFDSNMDTAFHKGNKPYEFLVGAQQVIPGWDEGLKVFKQGGKGTLYIPGMMAYKDQMVNKLIPPFSTLIFNIEIVEVQSVKNNKGNP
mgnify:CR=1 FL=1